jgi:hypothetical protein
MGKREAGLGFYVAARREFLGRRQEEIAFSLGYTTAAYAAFEEGQGDLALASMPALATLLFLSLDDLLQKKESPHFFHGRNANIKEAQLAKNLLALRLYQNLSPRGESLKIGIPKRTLVSYEKSKKPLSLSDAYRFMDFYSLKPNELLYERIPLPHNEKSEERDPKNLIFACVGGLLAIALIVGFLAPHWLH